MDFLINNTKEKNQRRLLRKKQTPQEILVWNKIRNNQLGYKFKRQVSIGQYFVDFFCISKNLAIEIDGSQHQNNIDYDNKRTQYLLSLGIVTLRFWNDEVNRNIEGVIKLIKDTLDQIQPHPSPLLGGEGKMHQSFN